MTNIEVMKQALDALEKSNPEPRKDDDDYCDIGWREHADAMKALRAAIARDDLKDDLTIAPIAGAASRSEDVAQLEEIESEWMGLNQDEGKVERAIERLTVELKEQLRLNSMGAEREYVLLGKVARLEQARDAALADAKQWRAGKTQKDAVIAADTSAMKKDRVPTELIRKLKVMYGLPPYNDPGNSARGDAYFFASIESEYSADTIEAAMTQVIRPMLQESTKTTMKGSTK